MRRTKRTIPESMKCVALALIVVFVVVLMTRTGAGVPFKTAAKAVEASLDTENLTEQNARNLRRNFGLDNAEYEGVLYYASEYSMSAEEVLLVKVKDEEQVKTVTDAVQKRIDTRLDAFRGYAPEEVKLLEQAVQDVRGTYIFYSAAPEADRYLEAFHESL